MTNLIFPFTFSSANVDCFPGTTFQKNFHNDNEEGRKDSIHGDLLGQ